MKHFYLQLRLNYGLRGSWNEGETRGSRNVGQFAVCFAAGDGVTYRDRRSVVAAYSDF